MPVLSCQVGCDEDRTTLKLPAAGRVGCNGLLGGLPLRAAPIPKLEDFVIRFVTQICSRICSDPHVAYPPADPRYSDNAAITEQIIYKPVHCKLLGHA